MKKQKIMWYSIGIIFLSFLLLTTYAQQDGKITQLTYSPTEPIVLENMEFSIKAFNPTDSTRNYLLLLQIVKEGKSIHEEELTFSLNGNKEITLSPTYVPSGIGGYDIVVKLYDNLKFSLYDTKFISFTSSSRLGPFDLTIDTFTDRIRPGYLLPTKITLENMGIKGTDVEVRVSIDCHNYTISQSLTMFVAGGNAAEKLVSIKTCDQDGLYDVSAGIILFNQTWAVSSNQFFVNSTYIKLGIEAPEKLVLKPGETISFTVQVTNLGSDKINNLQFVVQRIPLEWQQISPPLVKELAPDQVGIFIINITIPKYSEPQFYEIRMTASANEAFERKLSTLEVVAVASTPLLSNSLFSYGAVIIGLIIILIVIFLHRYLKRKQEVIPLPERLEVLKRIKEKLKQKR